MRRVVAKDRALIWRPAHGKRSFASMLASAASRELPASEYVFRRSGGERERALFWPGVSTSSLSLRPAFGAGGPRSFGADRLSIPWAAWESLSARWTTQSRSVQPGAGLGLSQASSASTVRTA